MTDIELQLNAWDKNSGKDVFCVQGEQNTRVLRVTLIDRTGENDPLSSAEKEPRYLDLTGYTARMYAEKGDGTAVYFDGTVTDAENGEVEFTLPAQAVTWSGTVPCTIELSNGDSQLKIIGINLNVQKSNLDDAVGSSDDFITLQTLIAEAEDAIDACESAAEGVNEAKNEAQTNAAAAAAAGLLANQKAAAAESAAANAQTQANAAQTAAGSANSAAGSANTAANRANEAAERVEDTDVSQLIQRINDLEAQMTPEMLKVWSCPDGNAVLELWAAASGGMVEYYATLNGTFSREEYTCDTLSGDGDGEMVNLLDADPIFIPELSQSADDAQCATFKGIIGVKNAEEASIQMSLINSGGATVQSVSANLAGHTMLHLGTVVPLGRVRSKAGVG